MDGMFKNGLEPLTDATLRQKLDDFQIDYVHTIDDDRMEEWPAFFTEDASYKIVSRENHEAGLPMGSFYCNTRGMMSDRVLALRTANIFEPHTYCHILGPARYGRNAAGEIEGRANFQVIRTMEHGQMDLFMAGKYLDHFDVSGPEPKLKSRLVVHESRQIDVLLCYPI